MFTGLSRFFTAILRIARLFLWGKNNVPTFTRNTAQTEIDIDFDLDFDDEVEAPRESPNVFATGTFEHVTLYDLMLTLVHGNKNGKVDIQIGQHKAMMIVLSGKLVTAFYKENMGDEAVLRIFTETEDHPNAEFFVQAVDPLDFPERAHTVKTPTDKLLFDVAMALDAKRGAVAA